MSLFNETVDVKLETITNEEVTIKKVVIRRLNMTLDAGDSIQITVNGNNVINATIPALKQVVVNINAQVKSL